MNQTQFIELVEKPNRVNKSHITDLQKLTHQHPYCSTLQLLYTKALHTEKHLDYNQQLKTAAVYAGNREVLYNLIIKEGLEEKINESKGDSLQLEVHGSQLTVDSDQSTVDSQQVEEKSSIVSRQSKIEATGIKKEKADTSQKNTQDSKPSTPPLDPIEEEILREAMSVSYLKELADEAKNKSKKSTVDSDQPTDGSSQFEVHSQESTEEEPQTSNLPDRQAGIEPQTNSFSGWLNKVEGREKSQSENDLINQFVNTTDAEPKAKKEFFSPTNMARMSLVEDERFVTETLANIYYKQGDFERAIKAYSALSLKIPEKKSYFAALIKKAEEQLKNK